VVPKVINCALPVMLVVLSQIPHILRV